MTDSLQTVRDLIEWGAARFDQAGLFFGHGTDNALDEAAVLVFHALHLPLDFADNYLDNRFSPQEREAVLTLLQRRIDERIPAAYLIHQARFAGLEFFVNRDVLVPRSPIAELIERGFEPWIGQRPITRILDLCTGSGCIAVACAYAFPEAQIDAVDISPQALDVARINIKKHNLKQRVNAIQSDLFSKLSGERYDLIVSNPPYVSRDQMAGLPEEYHSEPTLGLEAGDQGLDVVAALLQTAGEHLKAEGIAVIEVGENASALERRYADVPFLWLEFQRGGEGVFLLTARQLQYCRAGFSGR